MFLIVVALVAAISMAIAALRGEPLRQLAAIRFQLLPVLYLALGVRLLFLPESLLVVLSQPIVVGGPPIGNVVYVASMGMLLVFAWANRQLPGVLLIGIGLGLNLIAIVLNGGQMPGDAAVLAEAGLPIEAIAEDPGRWSIWSIGGEGTRVPWLIDRIVVYVPLFRPLVVSIGDLVLAIGVLCFFNQIRIPLPLTRWSPGRPS